MIGFISSRTPEGSENHCPICGAAVRIEPSQPSGDAPCPSCGSLLWFDASATDSLRDERSALCKYLAGELPWTRPRGVVTLLLWMVERGFGVAIFDPRVNGVPVLPQYFSSSAERIGDKVLVSRATCLMSLVDVASLDAAQVAGKLEDEFALRLSDEEAESMRTVGDLLDTIVRRRHDRTPP